MTTSITLLQFFGATICSYILPTELANLREDIAAKEELSQQQASDLEATRAELERARAELEKMSEEKDESKNEVDRLSSGELTTKVVPSISDLAFKQVSSKFKQVSSKFQVGSSRNLPYYI